MSRMTRTALAASLAIVLTWALGKALDAAATAVWGALPAGVAIAVLIAVVVLVSAGWAMLVGWLRLPAEKVRLWLMWAIPHARFAVRDIAGGRRISRGKGNQRWDSLAEFEAADVRRTEGDQCDYGTGWRDQERRIARLTHIYATGEFIALGADDSVEVLATIESPERVEALLADHSYACLFDHDLKWVRYRLNGWRVPLPPRARWWLLYDQRPPRSWPAPPLPSVGRAAGAYHGFENDGEYEVRVVDETGSRTLYHAVEDSPTGYSWGYIGAGPTDMARSLLLDRMGYVPQNLPLRMFRDEVVGRLESTFVLTYAEVDAWIDGHREYFALNPRAVPLDPYAAGGPEDP